MAFVRFLMPSPPQHSGWKEMLGVCERPTGPTGPQVLKKVRETKRTSMSVRSDRDWVFNPTVTKKSPKVTQKWLNPREAYAWAALGLLVGPTHPEEWVALSLLWVFGILRSEGLWSVSMLGWQVCNGQSLDLACLAHEGDNQNLGEAFLLTVGARLLTVKLLCLQSLKALIRRTFPL